MTEQTENSNTIPKRRRSWGAWIALGAIMLALACWFQLVHQQKKSTNNYSQLQNSFHRTLSDTAQLGQTTSDLQTQITNQNDQIQALQAAFNRLQATNSGYETDITLQQVDYYLLQANLSLNFTHNLSGSIDLLQAADQKLNNLSDAQIIPLRRAVASCIIKLQSIAPIDYVGVLSKLSALRDQAATLPLFAINSKTQIFHQTPTNINTTGNTAHPTWHRAWFTTVETLKSLVIIRNRHEEITPLLSAVQEQFLRQNLQLIFQQTQWAVLQHNQAVYAYSLTQASEWIQQYFADNEKATIAMQNDIAQLQKLNLTQTTPDISALMDQLHNIQLQINKSRTLFNQPTQSRVLASHSETNDIIAPAPAQTTITPPSPASPEKTIKPSETKGELV